MSQEFKPQKIKKPVHENGTPSVFKELKEPIGLKNKGFIDIQAVPVLDNKNTEISTTTKDVEDTSLQTGQTPQPEMTLNKNNPQFYLAIESIQKSRKNYKDNCAEVFPNSTEKEENESPSQVLEYIEGITRKGVASEELKTPSEETVKKFQNIFRKPDNQNAKLQLLINWLTSPESLERLFYLDDAFKTGLIHDITVNLSQKELLASVIDVWLEGADLQKSNQDYINQLTILLKIIHPEVVVGEKKKDKQKKWPLKQQLAALFASAALGVGAFNVLPKDVAVDFNNDNPNKVENVTNKVKDKTPEEELRVENWEKFSKVQGKHIDAKTKEFISGLREKFGKDIVTTKRGGDYSEDYRVYLTADDGSNKDVANEGLGNYYQSVIYKFNKPKDPEVLKYIKNFLAENPEIRIERESGDIMNESSGMYLRIDSETRSSYDSAISKLSKNNQHLSEKDAVILFKLHKYIDSLSQKIREIILDEKLSPTVKSYTDVSGIIINIFVNSDKPIPSSTIKKINDLLLKKGGNLNAKTSFNLGKSNTSLHEKQYETFQKFNLTLDTSDINSIRQFLETHK